MRGCYDGHNCPTIDRAYEHANIDRFDSGRFLMDPGNLTFNNWRLAEATTKRGGSRQPLQFNVVNTNYIGAIHPVNGAPERPFGFDTLPHLASLADEIVRGTSIRRIGSATSATGTSGASRYEIRITETLKGSAKERATATSDERLRTGSVDAYVFLTRSSLLEPGSDLVVVSGAAGVAPWTAAREAALKSFLALEPGSVGAVAAWARALINTADVLLQRPAVVALAPVREEMEAVRLIGAIASSPGSALVARREAIHQLSQVQQPEALRELSRIAEDPAVPQEVRRSAVTSVAKRPDALAQLAKGTDALLQNAARSALRFRQQ